MRFLILLYLVLLFFVIGCEDEKSPKITKPLYTISQDKRAAITRTKKIKDMEEREKTELTQFNKNIEILKRTDPFSPLREVVLAYNLTGIVWEKEKPAAIINNTLVRKGDMIGDKKVAEITKDKVILTKGDEKIILQLQY